jgi:hypothetical protein
LITLLSDLGRHALGLLVYPGLLTMALVGVPLELAWTRSTGGSVSLADLRRRPSPVVVTVTLCAMLAAVQLVTPFNPVAPEERSVVLAAAALAFTPWAELALTGDTAASPRLLLAIQSCWLLAVLGPAVQPESLAPQVLGNLTVPALLPIKVAAGFLYLICLPVLLRLWPRAQAGERRAVARSEVARALSWFAYCGLFTTLFVTPPGDDLPGVLRFFAITLAVAVLVMVGAAALRRRGEVASRGLYVRAVPAYAGGLLVLVGATSLLMR